LKCGLSNQTADKNKHQTKQTPNKYQTKVPMNIMLHESLTKWSQTNKTLKMVLIASMGEAAA
jgi:hypothetical protein